MFTYRRCQIHRLTAVLVYWGLFVILREELQTPGNFILFDLSEERVSIPRDIIAILAPCLTLALLWRIPRGLGKWVTPRLVVKSLCMVAVTCCNGHLVMLFCYSAVAVDMIWQNLTWSAQDLNSTNLIVAAMAILMAPGGFFTLGCVLVEIFDLPGRAAVSARIQQFLKAANRLGI